MYKLKIIFAFCLLTISACNKASEGRPKESESKSRYSPTSEEVVTGPVRDISWYLSNEDILDATHEFCEKNPGQYSDNPNCINAYNAYKKRKYKRIRELASE